MKAVAVVRNFATLAFLLAFLIVLPARADQGDQATKVTFNQAVQIPGRVLPAGTYWFVLPENTTEHNQVRIFGSDRTTLFATVFTNNVERQHTTDHTAFTFAELGSAKPQAIVTWFYPGTATGHVFLYPKQIREELAKDKHDTVVAGD
jgi:hypothetical protein